jgi:hypothetical protein
MNNSPATFARELRGHEVNTVQQKGWAGLRNGELFRCAADAGFEVFVTADRNLEFQAKSFKNAVRSHLAHCFKQCAGGPASAYASPAGRNSQKPARENITR